MSHPTAFVRKPAEIASKMRLLKIEALEKGELTDVSFLVGPEGGNELVHCFKSDLLLASEYFRGLFRSPLTEPSPIRMKHVKPHIFKILIQDISSNKFDSILTLEDAVDLAHAADEFLLDDLKAYYLEVIKENVTVDNVWIVLNRSKIPSVKSLCNEVLSAKTRECLAHESFLEASQESFMYLLELNEMNIASETELVDACLKLSNAKPEEERGAMIKAALPYLRLLTLKLDEMRRDLLEYLSESERSHLLLMMCSTSELAQTDDNNPFGNLCQTKLARRFIAPEALPEVRAKVLEFIPENKIIPDHAEMLKTKLIANKCCVLVLSPDYNVLLTALDILTPAKKVPKISIKEYLYGSKRFAMEKVAFSVNVSVRYQQDSREVHQQNFDVFESVNSWCQVKFNKEVFIPKGVRMCIAVTYSESYNFFPISNGDKLFLRAVLNNELLNSGGKLQERQLKAEPFCFMIKSVHFKE